MAYEDEVAELTSIFDEYFKYIGNSESPRLYHRWTFLVGCSSLLGHSSYIPFGHGKIHANLYAVLIGAAGTRKSTAISQMKSLMRKVGYESFAADRTSKEKFIADLQTLNHEVTTTAELGGMDSFLSSTFDKAEHQPAEILIAADELQDFMGQGNLDFITMLGVLWDCKEVYDNRVKHGKSSEVHNPYVSMLGGSTQTGFALAFPAEIVTQGFLSRLILIYGERTSKRIPFPDAVTKDTGLLTNLLAGVKNTARGAIPLTDEAKAIAAGIYNVDYTLDDQRFISYDQRRYTHMLKLALILSQLRNSDTVGKADVLVANTVLHHTEQKMSYALGEFGKSKNAEVNNTIISLLQAAHEPLTSLDIWKAVASDLTNQSELVQVLKSLQTQDKIKVVQLPSGACFTANVRKSGIQGKEFLIDGFISEEELNYEA